MGTASGLELRFPPGVGMLGLIFPCGNGAGVGFGLVFTHWGWLGVCVGVLRLGLGCVWVGLGDNVGTSV